MKDNLALSPEKAATIAANVYFTLEGWEASYRFKATHGANAKGAPKAAPAVASPAVVHRNIVGAGPVCLPKAGITKAKVANTFCATTGSNFGWTS